MAYRFKDPVSGFTHLAGAVVGALGTAFLVQRTWQLGSNDQVLAIAAFGASVVALYLSSSAYHLLDISDKASLLLRRLDHSMIFVLIAGSYTPFCLLALEPALGRRFLAIIWLVAIAGTVLKLAWIHSPRWLSTALYLGMGWAALGIVYPLSRALSSQGMFWLVAGGVAYTVGAVIYGIKKPDPYPPHFGFHEIWHLHVLAGTFFHYLSVATLLP